MQKENDPEKKKQLWEKALRQSSGLKPAENSLEGLPWKSKLDVLYEELKVEENYQKVVETEKSEDLVRKKAD